MEHYAGIDVSLESSGACVGDATGTIRRELKVPSEPEALVRFFQQPEPAPIRIGLEAGPLSLWLYAGFVSAGFDVVLLETRHVKAALSAMPVKTDRKDARGIAQMVRIGWSAQSIARHWRRRRPAPFWVPASSCRPICLIWSCASAGSCVALG
jgi:transposase